MRIRFDNGTPRGLARLLTGHTVVEARTQGWEEMANGELILTTDKNIQYQQNLTVRRLAIVV